MQLERNLGKCGVTSDSINIYVVGEVGVMFVECLKKIAWIIFL
jgi:hypothetical protein